jgi:hypothetical protein
VFEMGWNTEIKEYKKDEVEEDSDAFRRINEVSSKQVLIDKDTKDISKKRLNIDPEGSIYTNRLLGESEEYIPEEELIENV